MRHGSMEKKKPNSTDINIFDVSKVKNKSDCSNIEEKLIETSWKIIEIRCMIEQKELVAFRSLVQEIEAWTKEYGAVDLNRLCLQTLRSNLDQVPNQLIFMQSILRSFFLLRRAVKFASIETDQDEAGSKLKQAA